ncbi:hypothetical protein P879_01220 [Paragonimus westermani]|uniref:Cytohesin Ubiquitin Protein Inducing domain-containing protein n=1 Tax=Paragonimus westermani TaxID=34504 RepID=A0A8T0DYQ2_9TREM|nr:hypothetical protein P879_01220 [Paragonimus westermani]
MGMPPNHPLSNFRLISVPLVRCKPPKGLPTFPPDMQASENCNHQSQPYRYYPLQQHETQQLWYVLDKDVEKQLSTKHCHSSFPNLVPWSCVLHPNFAWPKAGSHPQYYNTIPLKSTPQKLHTHGSSKRYKDQPPVFMSQQSVRPSSVDALRNIQNVQIAHPVQLRRDPDLVKHCKRWPTGQTNVLQITSNVSSDQKIPMRSSEATDSNTEETEGTKNEPNPNSDTLPPLERKLNRLFERKRQLTEQLLEEERSLQRLVHEEMSITGVSPDVSSHMGHQCTQNGSQKSSSDLSIPSAEEESQFSRPNCIMGKFRWKTARRSKSAHERSSVRSQSHRKSMFRYTELSDESPNSRGFTPLDGTHQLPSEKRAETPVLRKHLKWWRLNRRRSTIEESKRHPSPEAVIVNSALRSRGNSMPPCDQRSTTVYSNTPRGRSNRSSMKMPGFIVPDWWEKVVLGNGGQFFAGHHHLPDHWIVMRNSNQVMLMNNEDQLGCRGHFLFQPTTQCPNHKMTGPSIRSAQAYTNVDRRPPFTETDDSLRFVPNTVTGDVSAPKLSKTDEHHRKHKQINRMFQQQPEQWTTIRCEPGLQRYSTKFRQSPPPIPPKGAAYQVESHLAAPVYFHPILKCEQDLRHAQTATTSSDSGIKYRSGELQGADGNNVKQFSMANTGQVNTTDRTTFVPIRLSDRTACTQTVSEESACRQTRLPTEKLICLNVSSHSLNPCL